METIDINFPNLQCKCGAAGNAAIKKSSRWGIYCKNCGKLLKWADPHEKVIIAARKQFLDNKSACGSVYGFTAGGRQ